MKNTEMQTIERNIETVHKMRVTADEDRKADQKIVDEVAAFMGSTNSLYAHFAFYGVWMLLHFVNWLPDRSFVKANFESISLAATLEAIFLAIFVLINQRRMNAVERRNSDLDLQMSLLVEHEVTKLAKVTTLIAEKIGIDPKHLKDLKGLTNNVGPDEILEKISDIEADQPTHSTNDLSPKNKA